MNRWKIVALILIGVLVVEILFLWKNWATIVAAYDNRKLIGDASDVAGGVSGVVSLFQDVKEKL